MAFFNNSSLPASILSISKSAPAKLMLAGTISILGVSEYPVPINTRMVLEKGLRIFGSSRSGVADFEKTVALYKSNPEIINYLSNIVGAVVPVRTIEDMKKAFEMDIQKAFGKTIMMWDK